MLTPRPSLLRTLLPWVLLAGMWLWLFGDVVLNRASLIRPSSETLIGIDYPSTSTRPPVMGEPWNLTGILPMSLHFARAVREGGFFQFDPFSGTGQPALADLQQRPFGVTGLLALLFPGAWALSVGHALVILLGLVGAMLLMRRLGAPPWVAVALATSSTFLAYAITKVSVGTLFTPWVLLAVLHRLQNKGQGRALDVLVLMAAIWTGHPSSVAFVALMWAAFWLFFPGPCTVRQRVGAVLVGTVLTVLTSAPQVFPYLANMADMMSYRNLVYDKVGLSWRDLLVPGALVPITPLAFLLLRRSEGEARKKVATALALLVAATVSLLVLSNAESSIFNRYFSLYYAVAQLPFLAAVAVAASHGSSSTSPRPGQVGLVLATALLGLEVVASVTDSRAVLGVVAVHVVLWFLALLSWWWDHHPGESARSFLVRIPEVGVVTTMIVVGVLAIASRLDRAPPLVLAAQPPLARVGVLPSSRHRIAIVGGASWEHPLPPNLAGVWGYQDISLNNSSFATLYAARFIEVFGRPLFPTFFLPRRPPDRDPSTLGVGEVLNFNPASRLFHVVRTGGVVATWRAQQSAETLPLDGYSMGYQGLWQTFTWQLPPQAQRETGAIEIKFTPLAGFQYDTAQGESRRFDTEDARWLVAPTTVGQSSFVTRYREDSFWLGMVAAMLGVVMCLRPERERRRPGPGSAGRKGLG
ncbi:MAG: hypothetical protein ABIJ09_24150 [Pseudomonadota bacterium]